MESGRDRGNWTIRICGMRFGFEYSPIIHAGNPYMYRWLFYVFGYTLRLHRIMRADLARDLHNHPFWFVTIPLGTYTETYWRPCDARRGHDDRCPQHTAVYTKLSPFDRKLYNQGKLCRGGVVATRTVRRFLPAFRGIKFRHRIVDLPNGPVWTFVISGRYEQKWGFFPRPDVFVPWSRTERNTEEPTE